MVSENEENPKEPVIKRSFKKIFFKWISYAILAFSMLLVLIGLIVPLFINEAFIEKNLKEMVSLQTGAEFNANEIDFNVYSGLALNGIEIKEPNTQNIIFKADQFVFEYSFLKLFIMSLDISNLKFINPKIYLSIIDGKNNLNFINEYRKIKFPDQETKEEIESEPINLNNIAQKMKFFFLPIFINIRNVGVENLSLDYNKIQSEKIIEKADIDNLSLNLLIDVFGTKSKIRTEFGSLATNKIKINYEKSDIDSKFQLNSDLKFVLEFDDLRNLNLKLNSEKTSIDSEKVIISGISIKNEIELEIFENLLGVNIKKINMVYGDFFEFSSKGSVEIPDGTLDRFRIEIEKEFNLSLNLVEPIIQAIVPGITLKGEIKLDKLSLNGIVDLNKLNDPNKLVPPFLSLSLSMNNIFVDYPKIGLKIIDFNNFLSLAVTPNAGTNTQIDIESELNCSELNFPINALEKNITINLKNINKNILAKARYPKMELPILKIISSIENIDIKTLDEKNIISTQFDMEVNASGQATMQKVAVNYDVDLRDIIKMTGKIKSYKRIKEVEIFNDLKIKSFAKIFEAAKILVNITQFDVYKPKSLVGELHMQTDISAIFPQTLDSNFLSYINESKLKLNNRLELNSISTEIPFNNSSLKDLDLEINIKGDLKDQEIEFVTELEELKTTLPKSDLYIKSLDYKLNLKNSIIGKLEIDKIKNQLVSQVKSKLNILKIETPSMVPKKLSGINFELILNQENFKKIKLEDLTINIPDFGLTASTMLNTNIDEKFSPINFDTRFNFNLSNNGNLSSLIGIDLKGGVQLEANVKSENMKDIDLTGFSEFSHFSVKINDSDEKTLVHVEDMNGRMPLIQKLNLNKILEHNNQIVKDKANIKSYLSYLEDNVVQNTASTVDYPSVKPFYPSKNPIFIKKIEVANLILKDLEFDVEVRQGLFAINQFSLEFLDGHIQGDVKLDINTEEKDPKKILKKIRTNIFLTKLNSHKLLDRFPNLRGKEGFSLLGTNPFIDSTFSLTYDVVSSDMSGGMEITSIGKEQLNMILYYVDPKEENPSISKIRMALLIGDVRLVSVPIKNGEIDLDVDVRLLGAPIPLPKVTNFPVAQIVRNVLGEEDNKAKKEGEKIVQ